MTRPLHHLLPVHAHSMESHLEPALLRHLQHQLVRRYEEGHPHFSTISGFWSTSLLRVFAEVPDISWK